MVAKEKQIMRHSFAERVCLPKRANGPLGLDNFRVEGPTQTFSSYYAN